MPVAASFPATCGPAWTTLLARVDLASCGTKSHGVQSKGRSGENRCISIRGAKYYITRDQVVKCAETDCR